MSERDWHVRAPRPANVRVGPVVWQLHFDHRSVRRMQINDEAFIGRANSDTCEIHVDEFGQPEDAIRATLLHEVLHAVWMTFGIDADHTEKRERQELAISRLEAPLLQVLRDNPLLVNYLTDQPHRSS